VNTSVPVTVVIPTLNEADRLPACLASVEWAADVIVVDAGSTDGTPAIARARGARVLESRGPTIGAQKNLGIAEARFPWVLSIDADEAVSPELRDAIVGTLAAPHKAGYRVHLRNRYLGAPYNRGGWGRDRHIRLYPRSCRWTDDQVHELLIISGEIGDLDGRLDHESYRDLAHQLRKCCTYAEWGAADLVRRGARVGPSHLVLNPIWRFVKTFLLESMWREGWRGFLFCAVHAWACFTKYALVWDARRKADAASPAPSAPLPVMNSTVSAQQPDVSELVGRPVEAPLHARG
jgi:glycosyltransferase involved in cell wall biosynthesis